MPIPKRDLPVRHLSDSKSPLRQYQQTVIGSAGLRELLLFECIETFIAPIPTSAGKHLRSGLYPFIIGSCGRKVSFGKNIALTHPYKIQIEDAVHIEDAVTLNIKGENGSIFLKKGCRIKTKAIISCLDHEVYIGTDTIIGEFCRLGCMKGLMIGKNCQIGNGSYIIGASHSYTEPDIPIIEQPVTCRGATIIGDNVHIGENVTIRDGVEIRSGATVADNSLVLHDVMANQHVEGVPARPVKEESDQ